MLKIYSSDLSVPGNKVRFVANYLGLEYEYIRMNLRAGEHRTEEFSAVHPANKIPAIDDNGFVLFESDAVCYYLAEKSNSDILPQDIKERAIVNQWICFSSMHILGAMGRVLFNRIFAPIIPVEVDESSLKCGVQFLNRYLPVLDKQLSQNKYIASDKITVADFVLLSSLDPAEVCQINLSSYQNILRYRAELQSQDFYTQCHTSYKQALESMMARVQQG